MIVKHANPCGVALAIRPLPLANRAFATDPTSAFSGIIAFNRTVDAACAEAVSKQFLEVPDCAGIHRRCIGAVCEEDQCAGADCAPA